ncbi:MAG: GtrA family protein [Pseudohongiellaceae bacterium]
MSAVKTVSLYSAFAAIATLVNLLTQEITSGLVRGDFEVQLAILAGTATGLISKYYLDARYIFESKADSTNQSAIEFARYALTGVGTTLLFWGFELGFDAYFETKSARYIGAIIGLTLGYYVKYQLDNHFVFGSKRTVHDSR